jgi:hypothetical protein
MEEVHTSSIVRRQTHLSYTSILGLGGEQLVLVVGATVVVVCAVEYADVWLVVESVAERRLTAG